MLTRKAIPFLRVFELFVLILCSIPPVYGQQESVEHRRIPDGVGILLMAHGGSAAWNAEVTAIAAQLDVTAPTEVAFGMAQRSSLQNGVDKLTERKVKQIVAVPLFVSSHSSVIESTRFLLGLRSDAPPELAEFAHGHGMNHGESGTHDPSLSLKPVTSQVPVRMTPALDRHRLVADILLDRSNSISKEPSREVVILVAHGPVSDAENDQWLADISVLAEQMASRSAFARIDYMTVRDDAPTPVRDKATAALRQKVFDATQSGHRVLIVSLLLSYGGIEDGLRKRLEGLDYTMSTQGLLPDPRLVDWVLESAAHSD